MSYYRGQWTLRQNRQFMPHLKGIQTYHYTQHRYIYLKLTHSILSCGCWEKGRINPHQKFKIPSDVEITDTMHSPLRHERNLNFIIQAYGTF